MINPHQPRDIPHILLSVLFLALIIISCLWVVQPFILSFAWAGTVVIAVSWRLYDAWVHEVPPPPKDPDVVLEELSELEAGRK